MQARDSKETCNVTIAHVPSSVAGLALGTSCVAAMGHLHTAAAGAA
jgi:hypothetical protein